MRIAIYPGTFDPITNGHLDIIERATIMFDKIIVAIAINSKKNTLFSTKDRKKIILEALEERKISNTEVKTVNGLIVNFAEENNAIAIIRGLRAISDFDYEFQMALMNRKLSQKINTVFLMPSEKYTYLNSSIVREISKLNGNVNGLVPNCVEKYLKLKIKK